MKEKTKILLRNSEYYSVVSAILASFIAGLVLSSFNYFLLAGLVLVLFAFKPIVRLNKVARTFHEKLIARSMSNRTMIYDDALLDVAQLEDPKCLSSDQLETEIIKNNRIAMALVALSIVCLFLGTVCKERESRDLIRSVSTQVQSQISAHDSATTLYLMGLNGKIDSLQTVVDNVNDSIVPLQRSMDKVMKHLKISSQR